ncbi:MAG TPA: MFS transporter [Polyangiales bacterium]|nr:MFS transporter [Polyangiales bacterium]
MRATREDELVTAEHEPVTQSGAAPRSASEPEPYPSTLYAWYCVILLLGIYLNSFLDRQMLALVVGPIKTTMGLTDSQVGFLMGPAFALFYTVAGLPLGWLADRMSRRVLIGVGQVAWSIASACFGLGNNYTQLVTARVGVGVGEASLGPSAYSVIADLFPPHRLARAMSVYGMGIYIGGGLANLVGGLLTGWFSAEQTYTVPIFGERMGWQVIFLMTALPVLPLTLLLPTLREPKRRAVGVVRDASGQARPMTVPFSMFLSYVWLNRRTMFCHCFGFAFLSFSGYGAGAWLPEFFIRVHGWTRAEVGVSLGVASMTIGPAGLLLGGYLSDRFAAHGHRDAKLRAGVISAVAWLPFGVAAPLVDDGVLAYVLLLPGILLTAMPWGIAPAAVQEIMPNQMRGQASGVYLFIINMLGLAGGPIALALLTDYVFRDEKQIHLSLVWTTTVAHILSAILLLAGLKAYRESRDRLDEWLRVHS